jgi:hypothetical protein
LEFPAETPLSRGFRGLETEPPPSECEEKAPGGRRPGVQAPGGTKQDAEFRRASPVAPVIKTAGGGFYIGVSCGNSVQKML